MDIASCTSLIDCFAINCRAVNDLLDQDEICSENRVSRLARLAGITAQIGYKRRPGRYGGKPVIVADNTYTKTHEGWSDLAVVIDLFSRRVVGWSMLSRMTSDLALQALRSAACGANQSTEL